MSTRVISKTIDLTSVPSDIVVSKYITRISNVGITVHPEDTINNKRDILINSNGISIRNNELPMMVLNNNSLDFNAVDTSEGTYATMARFGNNGAQIGQDDESHIELDYHSLKFADKEGNEYFYVSDLRDTDGYYTDYYAGDGNTTDFYFTYRIGYTSFGSYIPDISKIVEVKIDGVVQSSSTYSVPSAKYIRFNSSPSDGANIEVKYIPTNELGDYVQSRFWTTKAYTLGRRYILSSSILNPIGSMSVVEGLNNMASGNNSHAEGNETLASGESSHTEGSGTRASGKGSHAEGWATSATEQYSHAEGWSSIASGQRSHAEGGPYGHDMGGGQIYLQETKASGSDSHAEGCGTTASGGSSHSEGAFTVASGHNAHAQNWGTIAQRKSQTTIGEFNVVDTFGANENARGAYALIVGNGTADNARSNALTVDWDGNITINGHSSPIGKTETHIPNAISCASGKYYQIAYLTLDPGTWIISGSARFQQSNTTGIRRVLFTNDTSNYDNVTTQPSSLGNIWYQTFNGSAFPASGAADVKTTSAPINVTTENPTIRLIAYQSSGSAMNVTGRFYAIRIK